MAEDKDVDDHKSDASRELPHESSPNSRKRKTPPERGDSADAEGESVDDSVAVPKGEYETGRVMCEVCGEGVSFRDEATGGFTLKHWDAHRQQCANTTQAVPEPVIYTPESTAEALANPPAKRRRAKRTEEERIDYLRADPYVAQFEAYRVLCASCDKWIRLRPNSTYCSIPWDAHRKSCLSKKINNKNGCALEERNALLSKDPDVRKFDAERVLCNTCDRWIQVSPENHMQAVQKWLHHRSSCQKGAGQSSVSQAEASSSQPPKSDAAAREGQPDPGHVSAISRRPSGSPVHGKPPVPSATPGSPSSSFKDLTPTNFPAHESRRRNAEQRAATLKADSLVEEVEPNRVFCSLCKKWVQLRQDSSYCAYPWIQHRGKCLARHQRRAQKAADVAEMRAKGGTSHPDDGSLSDEDAFSDFRSLHTAKKQRLDNGSSRTGSAWVGPDNASTGKRSLQSVRSIRPKGRADSDLHAPEAAGSTNRLTRRLALGFADLTTVLGRMDFIFSSIAYLFMTTYDSTDDMTISSLLTYLNSAIPADKHEDFDTAEVVKAAAALQDRGDIIFEGDMLRIPE
ncbi:hypothetical protein EDB19DRAFT_1983129 [Suillus lakei]|nr:hypothetical protein EDB19DRAFT_1983129 [Suillus lakei]